MAQEMPPSQPDDVIPDDPTNTPADFPQDDSAETTPENPAGAAEQTATDPSAGDMAEEALNDAEIAAQILQTETGTPDSSGTTDGPATFELPGLDDSVATGDQATGLSMLNDVSLKVKIELGRTHMYVEDVLKLNADAVIELDKAAGDPVDIFVNDRLIARGEVLVLNENFCVRVSEIIDQVEPQAS